MGNFMPSSPVFNAVTVIMGRGSCGSWVNCVMGHMGHWVMGHER